MSTLYILYLFENTSRHFYLKHPLICMFIWKILIYLIWIDDIHATNSFSNNLQLSDEFLNITLWIHNCITIYTVKGQVKKNNVTLTSCQL